MNRNRSQIRDWLVVGLTCAAAWIVGGRWIAAGQPDGAKTAFTFAELAGQGPRPAIVENPFVARPASEAQPIATNLPSDTPSPAIETGSTLPIEGAAIETTRPIIYRLPPVTPPASEPVVVPEAAPESPPPVVDPPLPDDVAGVPELEWPAEDWTPTPPSDDSPLPYAPQLAEQRLFTPSSSELTSQLLPAVQRGCELAQRGALYAAQTEFIQVIRRIAQANDAARSTGEHSRALADGLRALDEATDYVPAGAGLEGELDVAIIASSHRTPLVRRSPTGIAPHTAVAIYHGFAQERLATAVGDQQAGSMALFGLGRVHARIAERNDDDILSTRSAMTMYLAALAACPANHMAANELGVLLCRNGRPEEAARLFEQAIDLAPSGTAYHNLAVAQQKLGFVTQAAANQQEADRLAAWERSTGAVSRRAGVEWIAPSQFAQVAPPLGLPTAQNAPAPVAYTAAPTPPKSPLQRVAAMARAISLPGSGTPDKTPSSAPAPRPDSPGPTATRNIPWF